jgi:hypothetical protein
MKKILVILVALAVLALPAVAAAEGFVWLTDPKTGCQIASTAADGITYISISWSGGIVNGKAEGPGQIVKVYELREKGKTVRETMEGTAEMRQGIVHGQVSLRWSDGMAYEGAYENGQRNGFGKLRMPDNTVFEGEWKDGVPHGKATFRGPSGRIARDCIYDKGTAIDKPFAGKVVPSIGGLLDTFQDLPWGASEDAVKAAYKNREGLVDSSASDTKELKGARSLAFKLRQPDGTVKLFFNLVQDKLASGVIYWYVTKEDELMPKFESIKYALTQKYGQPDGEAGKFLDKKAVWNFGVPDFPPNTILLAMETTEGVNAAGQKIVSYFVSARYANGALDALVSSLAKKQQGVSL